MQYILILYQLLVIALIIIVILSIIFVVTSQCLSSLKLSPLQPIGFIILCIAEEIG